MFQFLRCRYVILSPHHPSSKAGFWEPLREADPTEKPTDIAKPSCGGVLHDMVCLITTKHAHDCHHAGFPGGRAMSFSMNAFALWLPRLEGRGACLRHDEEHG